MNTDSVSVLTRDAARQLRSEIGERSVLCVDIAAPGDKVSSDNPITHGPIVQKCVDVILTAGEFGAMSLDDFSETHIRPMMDRLADALKNDGIRYTHPLQLPSKPEISASNAVFGGLALRGLVEKTVIWKENLAHDAFGIRFDVLYSRAQA